MRNTIAIFGFLGPLIGSFVFVGTIALQQAELQGLSLTEAAGKLGSGIFWTLAFGLLGIPLSIFFGAIPGSISGYVYWSISRKLALSNISAFKRFLFSSAISSFVTSLAVFLFYLYNHYYHGLQASFYVAWWFYAWPATIAGGICGLIAKYDGSRPY
ncbi:hypothetical protein A1353_14245 [Methylomonas methanica]|uniref:Uncharacterized protein n=1 Tax=Methylomonas methanica TaxID=421 RepID=A0A177MEQ9_METMH|nr:hypothetical protein [Methylomonas methanica]OAI03815.1 hypothetical protein A1353_14245 [Methylomonas methanica]